jgi:exodeoxyribonuclease VII large subunit
MAKPGKSQWDFGELFEPAALRRIWSVTELTLTIKRLLEGQIGQLWVTGEISNLRLQSSGHMYFTLKDANAQLNCVLFRGEPNVQRSIIQDGQKVVLQGALSVYEPRGQYQLRVVAAELQGVGALQLAFERLKQKLNAEGLFAPERKRRLPRFPSRLGVVTSPTGAALRDILQVIERRDSSLVIVLAACRVQGQGAAGEIAAAIRLLNEWAVSAPAKNGAISPSVTPKLDLILVTRGGGSLEDLWAFNEEVVARAIFESALPVVSAVGHEIDFTISDFVADFRAPTPSAAAEIITEGRFSARPFVAEAQQRLRRKANQNLKALIEHVAHWSQRLRQMHPRRRLEERMQRLDDLQAALLQIRKVRGREIRAQLQGIQDRLSQIKPRQHLLQAQERWRLLDRDLRDSTRLWLERAANHHAGLVRQLALLSPQGVLDRGYSITRSATTGKVIRRSQELRPGDPIRTQAQSGSFDSTITAIDG